jgi:hypothetical protein
MFKDIIASKNTSSLMYNVGITLLIIIISAFILRWLWNKVLVPHISVLKPVESLLDAFLLSIAIAVIRGS